MGNASVLVLHGPPGSGKSTLARAIVERLIVADRPAGMIDVDALSLVYPSQGRSFTRRNLRAVWPNYAAVSQIRIVLPLVVVDGDDLAELREITCAESFTVCELTAPKDVLERRVREREPDETWTSAVLEFVARYHDRDDHDAIRDFQVSTHPDPVADAVDAVLRGCGWP